MKITIQVMTPPYTYEDLDTAIKMAQAAVEKGHEVDLFLFADSVLCINKNVKPIRIDRNIPQKLKELIETGKVKVDICGICMDYRGITTDMIIEGAKPSGLPELAQLLYSSDRFINLMA
ncbi:DsrE/DsrF/TusD sulfur relay family protein [Thermotoga profunda]|uniref:DsrE/DsrF/TusD sulfur relay family protein n=1 Tax=Thermotoga profunda TaxID=1508420 RepID=UPI000596F6EC|nr:DsrE/DsrF/TusD sulfur relay family protein [Thermotoga profunda]